MIGIINMKTNNINCFTKILKRFNKNFIIIESEKDYTDSIEKIIIPGIGNYNFCMKYIINNGLDKIIYNHLNKNKKIMGICIGMQIFTSFGEEGGIINGLDIIKETRTELLKTNKILPNIGWCNVEFNFEDDIVKGINKKSDFYFVHSYNVLCNDESIILGESYYGDKKFISILKTDKILALQFHPEKSGSNGIKLIQNFLEW